MQESIASVALPGTGGAVSFKYDPFGRRIEKVAPTTGTTIYAYDGDNITEELGLGGNLLARYTQGAGIDEPLALIGPGGTYFYHPDGLGSISSLTDTTGNLAASYIYDSFGNLTASTGTITNPFKYTGREFDSESGLFYYRARYYDPGEARFQSEDPIGSRIGVNRFHYVANAPTNFTDPSGFCKISVGHHPIVGVGLYLPCGVQLLPEHAYIVIGDKGEKEDRWVFEAGAKGFICPWCHPTLDTEVGLLFAGDDETKTVNTDDPEAIQVTPDDGRPCELDKRILDTFSNLANGAGVPYHLLGPNSNSAAHAALKALGFAGWTLPDYLNVPGWNTVLPIPK